MDTSSQPNPEPRRGGPARQRPRRRPGKPPEPVAPAPAESEPVRTAQSGASAGSAPPRPTRRRPSRDPSERQWRELAGNERTALTLSAAIRARDADQPTQQDLDEAERTVVVQRRNWRPQE